MVDHPLTFTLRRAARDAPLRAVRDDLVRQQQGRRQPRRQRAVDRRPPQGRPRDGRRPAGRDPDRRPLRRRLHGRLPDVLGDGARARADDRRRDEPRAAPGQPRVPRPADRPGPVRLRVGDQVARRRSSSRPARPWTATGCRSAGPRTRRSSRRSRIDLPRSGRPGSRAGPVDVAGVAWAPDRGIAGVEVRIDDGPWQPARITRPISKATWVQWTFPWTASASGRHGIEVRATDDTGDVQTDQVSDPAPDGARGHHRIFVDVG